MIPAIGRGSGIPFDRQNSVFAGSAAGIAGPPHLRLIVFGKGARRRVNTPAVPGESLVRPGQKPMTSRYKQTQKQGSALTFGVLFQNCRSRKAVAMCEQPCRSIVNAQSGVLFGQAAAKRAAQRLPRALPPAPDLPRRRRHRIAARKRKIKKMPPSPICSCSSKNIGLTVKEAGGGLDRRLP
jgi:hypothetical protein